ncbi:MAG: hypothetical protein FWG64_13465, partial [Firmicutes bacterium]|nr:hypothetical protein [Bacillota bacterium]
GANIAINTNVSRITNPITTWGFLSNFFILEFLLVDKNSTRYIIAYKYAEVKNIYKSAYVVVDYS